MEINNDYDVKKIFEEIELDLIKSMKRTLWWHQKDEEAKGFKWPQWQAIKLKQMKQFRKDNKEIFKGYEKNINFYINRQIRKQFREGASRTKKQAVKLGKIRKQDVELGGSFFGINDRKVNALIKSVKNDFKDVKYATLRMSDDVFRSTIFKASTNVGVGAKTVKQAIDMATKEFLSKGFNCIEYKNGSRHNIADYCDMSIKTATKRANLMGEGEMRKQLGNPLVYISKHGGACDKCTPWEGRVYVDDVWSGGTEKDGPYPLLSTAIKGGLYHNRCRHGSSTYYPDVNEKPKEVENAEREEDKNDRYTQYLQQRQKQYERLLLGSIYEPNIIEYKQKASQLQKQIESSKIELSEEEQHSLNQYISSESYKVNELLRNKLRLSNYQENMINKLDKALDKMQKYEGDTSRSLTLNKSDLKTFLEQHRAGNIVKYRAYTSSTAGNRYNDLSNVELHIKSKNGRDIRKFNTEEQEILFKRDTKFKVDAVKKVDSTYHVVMEEIDD